MSPNPYAPPKASVEDVAGPAMGAPALWNPRAAVAWSLVFSPVFGALLHMKNWRAMGDAAKAKEARVYAIVGTVLLALVMGLGMVFPESRSLDLLSRGGGIGLLVGWYMASARHQIKHVALHYGSSYPRRGWWAPIGWALLVVVGLFVVVLLIALAMDAGEPG